MEIREKYIGIAERYSDKIVGDLNKAVSNRIGLNIYISGSISYGYCDGLSDIEMEFYLPKQTPDNVKGELQKIIDAHPYFDDARMSAGVSEWPLENIVYENIDAFWKTINPYQLYELSTALPIREDVPLIEAVKDKVRFYPDAVAKKVIKGLWLTINDSGSPYNADWSYKRGQLLSSNIFFFRSMEAILRLAYVLNEKYYPHTKWLEKGLGSLENDFGLTEFAKHVEKMDLKARLALQQKIIMDMGRFMVERSILSKELVDEPWKVLHEEYTIFSTF